MTITAKIIADSIGPRTRRLTTFELRYPRFIHAEVLTHRQFSRNASSSRAIPVERQIAAIKEDTAMPIHWGKNQPGMQASEECDEWVLLDEMFGDCDRVIREDAWLRARDNAIRIAEAFNEAGFHKQIVNRLLEPFSHITVVCTSTQYDNFFALRRHPDAQPEIKALADAMHTAMEASTPTLLNPTQWHLPYITEEDREFLKTEHEDCIICQEALIKVSVARCARVSYKTHDGKKPEIKADLALYDRLVGGEPLHASPAEHQAMPDVIFNAEATNWNNPRLHGNLRGGWIQYRKTLPNECVDNWEDPNGFME